MRRLKTGMILLLTALLITAAAFLPQIAGALQDNQALGQVHYDPTPSVHLEIREDVPSLGKLAMMSRLDGIIEISDSKASMTYEQVEEAAFFALQRYRDAGLMAYFDVYSTEIRCLLGHVSDSPEESGIFWSVTFVGSENSYFFAEIAIDDETGKPLRINYAHEQLLTENEREKQLHIFADIYFSTLDIFDHTYFATRDLEEQYIGENTCGIRYRFGDTVYGEINVDLYVHEHGFYTEFPDL